MTQAASHVQAGDRTPNRLAGETSPYLLQHQYNPVDWYPWGPDAFERARREDRPLLLSVGYSACHWCHVMERESFEDPAIAGLMNERFVNVKVDREERPDVDSIYMQAVQAMTGRGGWPMTVFLTPDGVPVLRRHLLPARRPSRTCPGFPRVLDAVAQAYRDRRGDAARVGQELLERLRQGERVRAGGDPLTAALLDAALRGAPGRVRPRNGGLGRAPKFPQPMTFDFLLRYWRRRRCPEALQMVRDDAHAHGERAASTTSSAAGSTATRSTRSGWCPISRRCSTTTPSWPASTSRRSRRPAIPVPARGRGDARLRRPRDDPPRGRLLLDPGRRQRGRRGQVLRLDGRRGGGAARARDGLCRGSSLGRVRRGNFEGAEHPARPAAPDEAVARRSGSAGRGLRAPPPGRADALRRPRGARPSRPRREGADGLERHDAAGLR